MTHTPEPLTGPAAGHPRPLTANEQTLVSLVAGCVIALALLGFVNSFAAVSAAAQPSFGVLAFTVPLGIDLGILVFAALDIVLARLDMRMSWLRLVPWSLSGVTIYLNVAQEEHLFGIVAHAVIPLLWVLPVEIGAHVIRKRARLSNPARMDRIRVSRWLLAFPSTLALWRRMVLWEIRSYPAALSRERDRVLAKTDLQDHHGRYGWRWKASRRERALYRLGELAPHNATHAVQAPPAAPQTQIPTPDVQPRPELPAARTRRTASSKPHRAGSRRKNTAPPPDVDHLMPLGWRIAAEVDQRGDRLTRDVLARAVRATGQSISTGHASALLDRLRTEAPTDPADTNTTPSTGPDRRPVRDAAPIRQDPAASRHPAPNKPTRRRTRRDENEVVPS